MAEEKKALVQASSDENGHVQPLDAKALERIAHIEEKLGLPKGFYSSLRDDGSDWEFSIKLVVVLEAALAAVIAASLHNDAVSAHVDKLNLDGRTGKLNLAESLGIVTPIERKAFAAIANVRNGFAHKIKNVTLNLEAYCNAMPQGDLEQLQKTLLMFTAADEARHVELWRGEHVARFMRLTMFLSGSWLLTTLAHQDKHAQLEAARRQMIETGWSLGDLFRGNLGLGEPLLLDTGEGKSAAAGLLAMPAAALPDTNAS